MIHNVLFYLLLGSIPVLVFINLQISRRDLSSLGKVIFEPNSSIVTLSIMSGWVNILSGSINERKVHYSVKHGTSYLFIECPIESEFAFDGGSHADIPSKAIVTFQKISALPGFTRARAVKRKSILKTPDFDRQFSRLTGGSGIYLVRSALTTKMYYEPQEIRKQINLMFEFADQLTS